MALGAPRENGCSPRDHPGGVHPRFAAQLLPLLFPPSIRPPPTPHPPPPSLINIAGKNKTKQSKYLIRSREPRRALPPSVSSASRSQQLPGPNEPECSRDRWRRQPPQRGQVHHVPPRPVLRRSRVLAPHPPPKGCLPSSSSSSSCPAFPLLRPLCPLGLPGGTWALLLQCSRPSSCCHMGHELSRASAPGWGLPWGCGMGRVRSPHSGSSSSWMGVWSPEGPQRPPELSPAS